MHYTDVRKFFSNLILEPYTLKDLRLQVSWARQDFLNSVMDLRTLELAKQKIEGGFLSWWGKTRRIDKAVRAVHAEMHGKRVVLDDLERALEIAENNDHKEMERRNFYLQALEETEYADNERYEKRLEEIEKMGARLSDIEISAEIRKQLAELFFTIDKIDNQIKREKRWNLYGPPSQIRNEFEKCYHSEEESGETLTPSVKIENEELSERVLCIDENCIGIIGDNGCCNECSKPHPDCQK